MTKSYEKRWFKLARLQFKETWLRPALARLCPSAHQKIICEEMGLRLPPAFDATRSFFIHVPKAAGTSVSFALYGQNIEHQTAEEYRRISPTKFAAYFKFAILREPLDRFTSSFHFLKKGGMNTQDADWALRHLAPYDQPEQLAAAFIDINLQHAILDYYHFKPQADFVCSQGRLIVDEIYSMADLRANFPRICRKLGVERELPHLNQTQGRETRSSLAESSPAAAILRCVYRRDFELYAQAMASASAANS